MKPGYVAGGSQEGWGSPGRGSGGTQGNRETPGADGDPEGERIPRERIPEGSPLSHRLLGGFAAGLEIAELLLLLLELLEQLLLLLLVHLLERHCGGQRGGG